MYIFVFIITLQNTSFLWAWRGVDCNVMIIGSLGISASYSLIQVSQLWLTGVQFSLQ